MARIIDIRRKKPPAKRKGSKPTFEPPVPPPEKPKKPLQGTLEYLFALIPGGVLGALTFARYSTLNHPAITALLDHYEQVGQPMNFDLQAECKKFGVHASELVGVVVSGMSKASLDYACMLKATLMPAVIEASLERAAEGERYEEVHDWLVAESHHVAPKAAQFTVQNNSQTLITSEVGGLPSFESSVGGDIERATRRMLPESSAVGVDMAMDAEYATVPAAAKQSTR